MTAFYFRQGEQNQSGDKTFEFTHKSFGEYLTAQRIVREVRYIHKKLKDSSDNYDDDWDENRALERWVLVCGSSAMDEYLFDFVLDEMRLQNQDIVSDWQKTLCHLIGFMLSHGMPMERLTHLQRFKEKNRQARNAEEALLVVLNSCARLTQERSKIKFPSRESFGTWISRLQGQRLSPTVFCLNHLSFLDLSHCILILKDFFDANLERANLQGANLQIANLEGANLEGVNLEIANLRGANLEGANLEIANLEEANLEGVNLRGAKLEGTILENQA